MKRVLFRADSSSKIGTGHIMRDLVLAEQFAKEGAKVIFAVQNLKGNINDKIQKEGYKVVLLKNNKFKHFQKLVQKYQPDLVVIDHYGIDYAYEKRLKGANPSLKLMVLDDTYERHYCDILLNHNISADASRYKDLVPSYCELRCGKAYTLIRKEFHKAKAQKRIFLAMGGADHSHINIKILEVLKNFANIKVDLVTTHANANLKALKKYVKDKKWIKLHINSDKIAKLMKKADFAIITPSVTLHEVLFMELPFIAIKTAENQEEMFRYLAKKGYPSLEVFDSHMLLEKLFAFLEAELIDFTALPVKMHKKVLSWRNHENIRRWMHHKGVISFPEHMAFVKGLRDCEKRRYFLVKGSDGAIGVIDFTQIDKEQKTAHIGLYAVPGKKRVGSILMHMLMKYGFTELGLETLIAEVYKENQKAIQLYRRFGFETIEEDEALLVMELKDENR